VRNRIAITGKGVICSAGGDVGKVRESLLSGKSCLRSVEDPRVAHLGPQFAGLIGNIDSPALQESGVCSDDRYVQLAWIAASEALRSSGIQITGKEKVGLILGTCSGPMLTIEALFQQQISSNAQFTGDQLFKKQYYSASMLLASCFGIRGPVFTVTTACSAFNAAVSAAGDLLRCGMLDIVLAGGADSFSTTTLAGFAGLKATSKQRSAPFSLPTGLNLGEGAGFLVLEEMEHAISRGASICGEILGYGLSNDAYHCSAPDPSGKGASYSMQLALQDSSVSNCEITYINAHGTGTEANDKAETRAIRKVFGEQAQNIPVSSLKGMVGHCLGAAGAVETVSSLICAGIGVFPPTVNFTEPRDGCNLDYIPDAGRRWKKGTVFIKNNFAFGGNNASLVISTDDYGSKREQPDLLDDPVCITGMGVVSPAGIGYEALGGVRLDQGHFREENRCGRQFRVAGVPAFELSSIDRRLNSRGIERAGKIASAAGALALSKAGIPDRPSARAEVGFYMNIAHGSTWAEPEHIRPLLENNYQLEQINVFPYIVPNSVTGTVCRVLSLTGYNSTFCNGPGAGLLGLGMSWLAVRNRHAPALLCGSVDDLSVDGFYDCFLSEIEDPSKVTAGEGAAMFLLEPLSRAKQRGAEPICAIKNVEFSFDPSSSGRSAGEYAGKGLEELIRNAVSGSGIGLERIGAVCLNSWNDMEMKAARSALGDGFKVIDTSPVTGFAPASSSMFNISSALSAGLVEKDGDKNYILSIFSSFRGIKCIMVLEIF